ncbi:MAG: hypothetical protein C4523_14485 [Myxococcales bacterium]|nr:MAG: hypothetical protein C4523_14485 [Myxococcales bacterium]
MSMRASAWLFLVLLVALSGAACSGSSSSPSGDEDTPQDGDGSDGDDPDGDPADGDGQDGDAEQSEGGTCKWPKDCANDQDCVNGQCVAAKKCLDYPECEADQICWYPGRDAAVGYCRYFCSTDMDCPEDGWCRDGLCDEYTPVAPGTPPEKHPEWEGKLHAAYTEGFLDYAFQTTMGGYGLRKGPNSPYSQAMGAATGMYDRLNVKVLTLDDGENRVVFVRLPLCFPTDFLVTGIVKETIALGGPDLRANIVASATHTHSGTARYWYLLPHLGFGSLGFEEFSYETYTRLTRSIAKVVYDAQQDLRPAAFGYTINNDFDPENEINRDRRSENDYFKDPRMMVWRIDDMTDPQNPKPWVITINYATHGTIEDQVDSFYTNDAGGGAELGVKQNYEKAHPGEIIHTIFLNGMAGDVSPSGGLNTIHTRQMMLIGNRVYDVVMPMFESITPSTEVDLSIVSKRVPIDREYVGYTDDQFFSDGASFGEYPPGGPLRFGGFQCGMLNTPTEENLDLFLMDGSGDEVKQSADSNTDNEGEQVRYTPEASGTFYIKVAGYEGCMNDYSLSVVEEARGRKPSDLCIDMRCGLGCGTCPEFKAMQPVECVEDNEEENDAMADAKPLELNTRYENGQICPFDDDWFKVELTAGERVTVKLEFSQDSGAYNPDTKLKDGNLGCVLLVERMNRAPIPEFSKTRFTSILFDVKDAASGASRTLYLAGLPGEPTSRVGLDTVTELQSATTFDDIVVLGYTNDHHFYLTAEDDWLQGGYNTTMSIWGFKFGEFLIGHLKQIAIAISEGRGEESANEFPKVKPLNIVDAKNDWRTPLKTPAPTEASIVLQPEDTRRMQEQAVLSWIGGDPGADFPHIYLERKEGEDFVQVVRSSGEVYDDRYYEMKLEFSNESFRLPNKPDADRNNYWKVTWEERPDFPLGAYRFRVEGRYYDADGGEFNESNAKPYTIYSDPFEFLPASIEVQDVKAADGELSGSVRYHRPVSNDTGDNAFEAVNSVALLLYSMDVEPEVGPQVLHEEVLAFTIELFDVGDNPIEDPVTDIQWEDKLGTVYFVAARDAEGVETMGAKDGRPITAFTGKLPALEAGTYKARITVTDINDNTGVTETTFVVE